MGDSTPPMSNSSLNGHSDLSREGPLAGPECAAEADLTPAETDAMAWSVIDEASQRKRFASARNLSSFCRETAYSYITQKGDERTNVIDQGERVTYALGQENLHKLFGCLEACRLEGTVTHLSERQGTPATPHSGLMIDFDLVVPTKRPTITERQYYRLTGGLVAALSRDIDFAAQSAPPRDGRPAELKIHVFFIVKPEAVPLPEGGSYKYGFHILVPGVKLTRAYKKWFCEQFSADPLVLSALQELGVVGDPAKCLDKNSASVPVLMFGSCKRGSVPYVLGAVFEVLADIGCDPRTSGWAAPPVIRRLGRDDLAGYNLVAEMGIVSEAEYEDGKPPLVRKSEFECRREVAERAQDWCKRAQGGITQPEELVLAERSLSTLTLHDVEARHLHALLDILGEEYYTDRNRWRDVVFALANTNDQYKPLAVWFSHKCPQKWAEGGPAALDQIWEDALASRGSAERPLTIRSVAYWARVSNPARYAEVMERSYFTMLAGYVYDHKGKLQHYMVAKVLHVMLGAKFCVDIDSGARGTHTYCWFEFVLPGQPMRAGEVWKWRKEVEPDDVHIYMSEKLTRVLDQISDHIEERRAAAANEEQAKYYKMLGKTFDSSKDNLYNDTFKNGVVRQANYLFRRRGFVEQLDNLPFLFGTLNGVLKLGPQCALIDYFHEYAISRYSPVAWKRFDPADPWVRLVLGAIADIIVEPDARDWILYHAAQGLSGEPKEGLFLLWEGGGQNGKTSFLRWIAKALGPYADKFNIQLLCCEREEADRPNSAMMRFKRLNWAYSEESNKAQQLNVARMKEMVNAGEVSGRDLNSRQETFTMRCNLIAASQYSFIIDTTDHGTWRRLRHYSAKSRFRKEPDLTNPYEKLDDQRFVRQYPEDPNFLAAVLSILVHYYERLQNEFGGELKNVRSPTIERETEAFRVSQDALHRWISESVVVSPACGEAYTMDALSKAYTDWYSSHIIYKHHVSKEVFKEIESSAIGKYLKPSPNRTLVLKGCRILTGSENWLRPDEEYIHDAEMRGRHSAREWELMSAEAQRTDGRKWWEARSAPAGEAAPPRVAGEWDDDATEFPRADAGQKAEIPVDESYIDGILGLTEHRGFSIDDVYV